MSAARQWPLAWLPMMTVPTGVIALTWSTVARWQAMWLISVAIFYSFKWLSWHSYQRPVSTVRRKIIWWTIWPGMDPTRFLSMEPVPVAEQPTAAEWTRAVVVTILSVALFIVGIVLVHRRQEYAAAWCGMFGLVFALHFGIFQVLSCLLRWRGIDAPPIMNFPLRSASAGEFWGRRWNRAFRDTSYAALFKPVARGCGPAAATWTVFLFSGIIHDLAISVPAHSGYGLPTLYFLLQGTVVLFENSAIGKQWRLGHGARGRIMTLGIVFFPLPILFHPPFVRNVMAPFLRWAGTI